MNNDDEDEDDCAQHERWERAAEKQAKKEAEKQARQARREAVKKAEREAKKKAKEDTKKAKEDAPPALKRRKVAMMAGTVASRMLDALQDTSQES